MGLFLFLNCLLFLGRVDETSLLYVPGLGLLFLLPAREVLAGRSRLGLAHYVVVASGNQGLCVHILF